MFASAWFWVGVFVLCFCALMINWVTQSRQGHAETLANIAAMLRADRAELTRMWHVRVYKAYHFKPEYADRLAWEPNATAPVAMAVTPRGKLNESDALYLLYHGDKPQILFGLSSTGVFVNDVQVNQRKYPEKLLPRALTTNELAGLTELIGLIKARRDRYNPQSPQYIWTDQVLKTALDIKQAQQGTAPAPH
jgi:hypothetical protein